MLLPPAVPAKTIDFIGFFAMAEHYKAGQLAHQLGFWLQSSWRQLSRATAVEVAAELVGGAHDTKLPAAGSTTRSPGRVTAPISG
jgi:hypothetical protein